MEELFLSREHIQQIQAHLQANLPEEACGLLAGWENRVSAVIPITNQAHSPVRFYMDPLELNNALIHIEEEGLELLAIFHSHPSGPDHPSPTDIREFYYPGTAVMIWSHDGAGNWQGKAYKIDQSSYTQIAVTIIDLP